MCPKFYLYRESSASVLHVVFDLTLFFTLTQGGLFMYVLSKINT